MNSSSRSSCFGLAAANRVKHVWYRLLQSRMWPDLFLHPAIHWWDLTRTAALSTAAYFWGIAMIALITFLRGLPSMVREDYGPGREVHAVLRQLCYQR